MRQAMTVAIVGLIAVLACFASGKLLSQPFSALAILAIVSGWVVLVMLHLDWNEPASAVVRLFGAFGLLILLLLGWLVLGSVQETCDHWGYGEPCIAVPKPILNLFEDP